MRLLAVADIHYALRQFDWIAAVAGQFDAVILAGDLLELSSAVDRRAQIVVVRAYLQAIAARTRLVVCSGNHDLDVGGDAGERTARWMQGLGDIGIASDGGSVSMGSTLVTACGWWDGDATRSAIEQQLTKAAKAAAEHERWIWAYHAPPAGRPVSWAGNRHFGDTALTDWIAHFGPDIVFSGHVHNAPFVPGGAWVDRIGKTWVFNAGHQIGPIPAHVVVETDGPDAAWSSIYDEGWIDLRDTTMATPAPGPVPDRLRVLAPSG